MANRYRGEIDAQLDGRTFTLCLTLGALAELEDAFGADDMVALAHRFEQGRIRSRDALKIIGAGLRGGGQDVSDDDVAAMQAEGGAAGFVDIVARLLRATFSSDEVGRSIDEADGDAASGAAKDGASNGPFPGTT